MAGERARMLDVMSGMQLQAVREFLDAFEREAIEDLIHATDPAVKQERVRTVREIREQFKPPRGDGGQA